MTHARMRVPVRRVASLVLVAVASMSLAGTAPVRADTGSAYVRVDQVGYEAHGSKRAYLMASGAETGAAFSVVDSHGNAVFSGAIGADLGSWSPAYPHVYAVDFNGLADPGTYTVAVDGPI